MIATSPTTIRVSPDHAAFLAAICEQPDDDLPRLIYADYLDDCGEHERAEFVRIQCELARVGQRKQFNRIVLIGHGPNYWTGTLPYSADAQVGERVDVLPDKENGNPGKPKYGLLITRILDDGEFVFKRDAQSVPLVNKNVRELRNRERELLSSIGPPWPMDGADVKGRRAYLRDSRRPRVRTRIVWTWVRGFVSRIRTRSHAWLTHGQTILRQQPVERVELTDWQGVARMDRSQNQPDMWVLSWAKSADSRSKPYQGRAALIDDISMQLREWAWRPPVSLRKRTNAM